LNNDNIIEYKSIPPYYDIEISGYKPFTIRYADLTDKRTELLNEWTPDKFLYIRIVNTNTQKSFIRRITNVSYIRYFIQDVNRNDYGENIDYNYQIIHFDTAPYIEIDGVIIPALLYHEPEPAAAL